MEKTNRSTGIVLAWRRSKEFFSAIKQAAKHRIFVDHTYRPLNNSHFTLLTAVDNFIYAEEERRRQGQSKTLNQDMAFKFLKQAYDASEAAQKKYGGKS